MLAPVFADPGLMIMLTGALVGVAATLVGTFLVLRGSAMLSDAVSHAILFGIVVVWLLTARTTGPLQILGAALAGLLTVFLTELLAGTRRVKTDAAIGLVFPALFSIAVLLINLYARDIHIDAHAVLLGEIGFVWLDTIAIAGIQVPRSVVTMAAVTVVNLAFVLAFYKELKLATFDVDLARALGFAPTLLFYALLGLTSVTAVAAFDAVGVILFIAFVIVPPSTAYLLTDRLSHMLLAGIAVSILSSGIGYWTALRWDVSIGGMMAVTTGLFLAVALLAGPRHGIVAQAVRRARRAGADDGRAVALHLYAVGPEAGADREGGLGEDAVLRALVHRLGWDDRRARRALASGLEQGMIALAGGAVTLTGQGRRSARQILEPWRQETKEAG